MSKDITIASTTDSQEEVNLAAGILPAKTEEETPAPEMPEAPEKGRGVESTSGTEAVETGEEAGAESEAAHPQKAGEEVKGRGGFTKRIDTLTRRNRELQERLESLADQHEDLIKRLDRGTATVPPGAEATLAAPAAEAGLQLPPKPTPDQFLSQGKSYEDYIEALTAWQIQVAGIQTEQKRTAESKAESKKTEEAHTAKVFASHNQRMREAVGRYDDFEEVMKQTTHIPRVVGLAIVELENGPDVAYYLGKNPDICEELMGMGELAAVAEIGAMAASLRASGGTSGEKPKPVSSSAPAPIKPGGGASTKSSVPLDEVDYPTYRRVRAEQEKARYRT